MPRLHFTSLIAILLAACHTATSHTHSDIATPETTKHSETEKSASDSAQRTSINEFIKAIQTQTTPLVTTGNYLGAVRVVDSLERAARDNPSAKSIAAQLRGTFESFMGEDSAALTTFALGPREPVPVDSAALRSMRAVSAVDAVASLAANRRAVFVNEAHHMPVHRAFTAELLPLLYREGFRYLAVETLADDDTALNARKYPTRESGYYSNEPIFGDMLRTALRLGYTLVPYEAKEMEQDKRELGQARHIVERILKHDSAAKILVHAGYDHINESGTLGGAKPMAIRFRELTGIDPLTVDQTVMTDMGVERLDDDRYRFVLRALHPTEPIVLARDSALWSARPGVHDVSVIHPAMRYSDGRPTWRLGFAGRKASPLASDICGSEPQCLVTARRVDEAENAVPIDAIAVSRAGSHTLILPPGRYVVVAKDSRGRTLTTRDLTIE